MVTVLRAAVNEKDGAKTSQLILYKINFFFEICFIFCQQPRTAGKAAVVSISMWGPSRPGHWHYMEEHSLHLGSLKALHWALGWAHCLSNSERPGKEQLVQSGRENINWCNWAFLLESSELWKLSDHECCWVNWMVKFSKASLSKIKLPFII